MFRISMRESCFEEEKRDKRIHPLLQPSKDKIRPKWKKPGTIPSSFSKFKLFLIRPSFGG